MDSQKTYRHRYQLYIPDVLGPISPDVPGQVSPDVLGLMLGPISMLNVPGPRIDPRIGPIGPRMSIRGEGNKSLELIAEPGQCL